MFVIDRSDTCSHFPALLLAAVLLCTNLDVPLADLAAVEQAVGAGKMSDSLTWLSSSLRSPSVPLPLFPTALKLRMAPC